VYLMGYSTTLMQAGLAPGTVNEYHNEVAHFDTRVFDGTTPWSLFNVMMIKHKINGVSTRITVGRIHVAAFMDAAPREREVVLE